MAVENGISKDIIEDLTVRGHKIVTNFHQSEFGGAQLIYRNGDIYIAGSDHRKDGMAAGF